MLHNSSGTHKKQNFFSVSDKDVLSLHQQIVSQVIPNHTLFIREALKPHLVQFNEETGKFSTIPPESIELDRETPQVQYVVEVDPKSFPEFVTEFTGSPFAQDIEASNCEFRCLDKAQYNSILRGSSDLIKQVTANLSKKSGALEGHNVSNFYTEFFLNNQPAIKKKSFLRGVLQILFVFDVSYRG